MAKLSLEALDLVSGGMDVRTLQTHLGGASGLGSAHSPTGGPGFAPILGEQFDPGGLGSSHGPSQGMDPALSPYGAMPSQGLDPYAQGAPYGAPQQGMMAGPPPEHHSSFAENVQAITGIMSAFAGIIGQFTGGAQGGAPAAGRGSAPREQSEEPQEQGRGAAPHGSSQEEPTEPSEPATGASAEGPSGGRGAEEPSGGHTNFRETSTGFERT